MVNDYDSVEYWRNECHKAQQTSVALKVELDKYIEKDTPMEITKYMFFRLCPRCEKNIFEETNYCPDCGQRLKWHEDGTE